MAEKEAWRIAKEHGLDLVTIHPVFVVGPVLSDRTDATSVQMIKVRGRSWEFALVVQHGCQISARSAWSGGEFTLAHQPVSVARQTFQMVESQYCSMRTCHGEDRHGTGPK